MSPAKIPPKAVKSVKDTVYLDVDDEITAIIEKVDDSKQKIVALVLPKRTATLQSIVNMRLLKRSADNAEKNVVLITSEAALLPLAGVAGLHVAKNLQSKPEIPPAPFGVAKPDSQEFAETEEGADIDEKPAKLDYHRSMGELAAADTVEEPETIALGDEEDIAGDEETPSDKSAVPKDKKLKIPNFEKFRLLIVLGVVGLISLIVFIVLALVVWPHATVTIQTTSSPVSANFNLTTSGSIKKLDEANKIIPAVLQSSKQTSSQQVQATGQQNNGKKASGSVTMTDCVSGFSPPSSIAAGIGISANNGLTFITQEVTTFSHSGTPNPQNSCIEYQATGATNITAQTGGAKYNVSNTTFSIDGRSDVSTSGSASGGTDDNVKVVSQEDINNAKKSATSVQSSNDFTSKFEKDLSSQGLYVLTSTLKAADPVITATPSVGQPASTVNVSIKITYSVLTVTKSDLQKIIGDNLKKQIDSSRQKLSNDDPLKGATVTVQGQSSSTVATLNISITTTAMPILDVEGIKKQVGGQKKGNIKDLVTNIPGVKDASVKMNPFWVSKAPKNTGKITIILQQVPN